MSRPRNPAHRDALLAGATRVFAREGIGASTASIARAAGVSTGALFVYFPTKADLVNELYVSLKSEMGYAGIEGFDPAATDREQLHAIWRNWERWATEAPQKRRALAVLTVAEALTDESRAAVHPAFTEIALLLHRILAGGPMEGLPLTFVTNLLSAIADATLDDILTNPAVSGVADRRSELAFAALWRALGGAETEATTTRIEETA